MQDAQGKQTRMTLTFVVFLHLIATSGALGTIVLTDMCLLAKLVGALSVNALVLHRLIFPLPGRWQPLPPWSGSRFLAASTWRC